ncbi:NAD(P)-binding protein [Pelotomaculum terephthalicicum]|uniref:NAD(P)-binding protein n=1 Tax=Pelotomaculum terephthalicicum TaxID=206393 RepID=UPI0035E3C8C3
MRICIIGAGISGLSCALTLEKYGIIPDIYEQYPKTSAKQPFTLRKSWDFDGVRGRFVLKLVFLCYYKAVKWQEGLEN